jgi:hypothetical protein
MQKEAVCRLNQIETQIGTVLAEIEEFKKLYIADRTYVRNMFTEVRKRNQQMSDQLTIMQEQIYEMECAVYMKLHTSRGDAEWK